MLFNSIQFAVFLPVVFILYWFIAKKNLRVQNVLLLVASYVFYGWWDWRFLCLLILMATANYIIGIGIGDSKGKRAGRVWFIAGLIINLGVLGVFKYFNFFIDSFIDMFGWFGYELSRSTTRIILPVGISFYTFLSLSYIIDIHKKTLVANRNIIDVLLSLGFFPIILAGPIQRPASLLSQIAIKREFNYALTVDGLRQILWGMFTKVVIADNLATYVDDIFLNYSGYSGSTLLLGAILYSFQIYADFSGYSNIAIGVAKLFGFSLVQNFAYPYFSRDITEFWKRWHISLVTWFRDYVFLPISFRVSWRLTGERVFFMKADLFIYIIASAVVWFLTGLWHGASYTFIIWGMIHGFLLILYRWQMKPRKRLFKRLNINNKSIAVVGPESFLTFIVVMVAWIFFRADSAGHAVSYISGILSSTLFSVPAFPDSLKALPVILLLIGFIVAEWFGRDQEHPLARLGLSWRRTYRFAMYYMIIILIIWFSGSEQQFIYFQF
jgi:alginate O-acetyltransferase complex protein AlgI